MPVRVAGKAIRDLEYLHSKVNLSDLFDGEPPLMYNHLERTLDASEKYLHDNDTVMFASATLKRILTIFQNSKAPLPKQYWNLIILHIRRIWDYSADRVCHDAVETFALLLEIHLRQCEECLDRHPKDSHANCDWINETMQWLLEPTSLCRSRFRCISHLVVQCPTLRLNLGRDFFNRIYPQISNPSFSSVIFQLIVDNIFDRDELWDLHCEQLLSLTDAKLIKSRLIPLLQKYHPSNTAASLAKSSKKQPPAKPLETDTAVKFLNQMNNQMNSNNPQKDLQSQLEIVHALVCTTWPRKKVRENEPANLIDFSYWNQCIDERTMSAAIVHVDPEVRLAAFRVVVENPRKTVPYNEMDIECIKTFLASNMPVQSASSRQQLLATYKFLCQRLGASAELYLKAKQPVDSDSSASPPNSSSQEASSTFTLRVAKDVYTHPLVSTYIELAKGMASLAFASLSSKANFYRRIMGLMQIEVLFNRENFMIDGKGMFSERLDLEATLGSNRHTLVLGCLDDSYELVQTTALGLLKKLDFGTFTLDEDKYLKDAFLLMTSTKSRNSTSAGYRMQYYLSRHPDRFTVCMRRFLSDLKERTELVEQKLINITTVPVHPVLNILELLLKNGSWTDTDEVKTEFYKNEILKQLLPVCHQIVQIVSPVVHSMSPEGCIPDEMLDEMCGTSTDRLAEISQHLLVCCWRAHKHVSAIFSWIIETLAPQHLVSKPEIEDICTFYWTQLTECKHRGAFESATEGFTELCKFLWSTDIEDLRKPADWLDEILAAIRGEKDLTSLCSTRRSAGLPHLVHSIVATEPKSNDNAALIKAIDSLLTMEGKEVEYRVHSMNVMKVLVQSSQLHERIVFCYERCLKVAIEACRAEWSERNAASQVFGALRTKIFGVMRSAQRSLQVDAKNRKSNYEFFSKFPTLYRFLYDQILEQKTHSEFSLLPPLVILTHLYTPPSSSDLYPLGPFVPPLLQIALNEKNEGLRAHAVAAILAIADVYAKNDLINWILSFDYQNASQNQIHSVLLMVEGLADFSMYSNCPLVQFVYNILTSLKFKTWCDFNINQLLSIANDYQLEYDVDEVTVDQVCLAKRPIALKILRDRDAFKSEMCRHLREVDTRREVYRTIFKLGWDSCNMFLRAHIISIAIKDLSSPDTVQSDAKRIMQILTTTDDFMSKENKQKLVEVIEQRLDDRSNNWTLPSTKAYAIQIKSSSYAWADNELLNWVRDSYELDDPETREIALDVAGVFVLRVSVKRTYTNVEKEIISVVMLYLQDEMDGIRQRAAFYLGHLIRDSGNAVINPEVCRLLVIKYCLNEGDENLERFNAMYDRARIIDDRDDLFDACAINQYEESQLFASSGDILLYEAKVGFSGYSQDMMYDMDY